MATFTGTASAVDTYPLHLGRGNIDYQINNVTCWLTTGGTAPTDALEFASQIVGEVTDTDYSRQNAGTVTWTQSGNRTELDSAPVTWTASTADISARWYVLVYNNGGTENTQPVIQWGELDNSGGAPTITVSPNDSIIITPGVNGWNDITVAAAS